MAKKQNKTSVSMSSQIYPHYTSVNIKAASLTRMQYHYIPVCINIAKYGQRRKHKTSISRSDYSYLHSSSSSFTDVVKLVILLKTGPTSTNLQVVGTKSSIGWFKSFCHGIWMIYHIFGYHTVLSWYLDNIPYIWLSHGICHGIWMIYNIFGYHTVFVMVFG